MIDPLLEGLADPDPEKRRKAIFGVLSHRRHDLLPALYEFALSEKEGELAILATQVVLSLRAAPQDDRQDALVEQALSEEDGISRFEAPTWEYLTVSGNRRQRLYVLARLAKSGNPPRQARGFIESCMGHCDPDVRMAACRPAVGAGCGRLLAWVLAAIEDPDAGVGREAFSTVETASRPSLVAALGEALVDPDEWVPGCVAAFLPVLVDENMREVVTRGSASPLPQVAARSREALGRLDARKIASQQLPPPPTLQMHKEPEAVSRCPLPIQEQKKHGPVGSSRPPGPLPWAHLVMTAAPTPPSESEDLTRREKTEPPPKEPAQPQSPYLPMPADEEFEATSSIPEMPSVATPVLPPAERGIVKKDRVISMRGKIAVGEHPMPTTASEEKPPRSLKNEKLPAASRAVDSSEERLGAVASRAIPVAVSPAKEASVPAMQPSENRTNIISINTDPALLADSDVWEAVAVDLAGPKEPRLSVCIDSIMPEEPQKTAEIPRHSQNGMMTLEKPQMIDAILLRYPSFITSPLAEFFKPADPASLLKTLRTLIEPLIAFLSFTFLQTYLFFSARTPKGDQAARDALKVHFSGPTGVRTLHHLSISVKEIDGDSFFTTGLARAMSEAPEDANPLFMLREVMEFLQTPAEEASEGLRQVAEGLPALLASLKGILHHPIVLKLPPGAREPYLNLSGPRACPLAAADRPGLDLPSNEIILLSRDRSEALGLFPYFRFNGQEIKFNIPSDADFKTLLERLELTV